MSVSYKYINNIDIKKLDGLIYAVGWGARGKAWEKILSKSSFIVTAWDDDKLVGFGRVLEDGIMCMIYDIAVLPEYQGQKIGKNIMKYLLSKISKQNFQSVGLFAWDKNPKNKSFYESLGFYAVDFGMKLNLTKV